MAKPSDPGSLIHTIENEIKENLDIILPTYLKNVLVYTGFDSSAALSELTVADFSLIEDFVRNELQDILSLERNVQYDDFYGIYSSSKSNFKILPGHKKLLMEVQKFYKGRKMEAKYKSASEQLAGAGGKQDDAKDDMSGCLGFLDEDKQSPGPGQTQKKRKRCKRKTDTNSDASDGVDFNQEVMIDGVKRRRLDEAPQRADGLSRALVVFGDDSRTQLLSPSPSESRETVPLHHDSEEKGFLSILNSGLRLSNII